MNTLDIDILNRTLKGIAVTPPYFALSDIQFNANNSIVSKFPVEQSHPFELTPISGAESSRHMAILGSVLLSHLRNDTEKSYYLAFNATFNLKNDNFDFPTTPQIYGHAILEKLEKRNATVYTQVLVNKKVVFDAVIDYVIVPQKVFERMNITFRHPLITNPTNPYSYLANFTEMTHNNSQLKLQSIKIRPESCVGHFDNYPAMPVAHLMSYFGMGCAELLAKIKGTYFKYSVKKAVMDVRELAFATQKLDIIIELISEHENVMKFKCAASINNKVIALLTVEYQLDLSHKIIKPDFEKITLPI